MKNFCFISLVFTLFYSTLVLCQIPSKISYQGLLTTSSGLPVQDGLYYLKFSMYDSLLGGNLIEGETVNGVQVQHGAFSVILHAFNGFTSPLFIEVTALSGPDISSPMTFAPRSELTSAPYALNAKQVDGSAISVGLWSATNTASFLNLHSGDVTVSGTGTHNDSLHFTNTMGPGSEVRISIVTNSNATSSLSTVLPGQAINIKYPHYAPFMIIVSEAGMTSSWTTVIWTCENDGGGSYVAINHDK